MGAATHLKGLHLEVRHPCVHSYFPYLVHHLRAPDHPPLLLKGASAKSASKVLEEDDEDEY
jgi:hypothetical protein